jgi:ABC-type amino acid transport substrate-binding protein
MQKARAFRRMRVCSVAVWLVLTMVGSCGTTLAGDSQRGLVLVASHDPPYAYVDDFWPCGLDVDVTARILDELGIPFEIMFHTAARCRELLESGQADAGLGVPYEASPAGGLYFAVPPSGPCLGDNCLHPVEHVFFIRRHEAARFLGVPYQDLEQKGFRIAVGEQQADSPGLFTNGWSAATYASTEDAFRALAGQQVDLVVVDRIVGHGVLDRLGLRDAVTYLPHPVATGSRHLAFSAASTYPDLKTLASRFGDMLARLRASGEYEAICHRHVRQRFDAAYDRPFLFVGTEWPPYEFSTGDRVGGINVEVATRIMKRLGVPCAFALYPWSRAWMMAEKGGADAVLSVSYQQEREPVAYFTDEQRTCGSERLPRDYLWASELVFFVKRNRQHLYRFGSLEQLKDEGFRVGTNRGYAYTPAFHAAGLGDREYGTIRQGMTALLSGDIDLYPMERVVGVAVL